MSKTKWLILALAGICATGFMLRIAQRPLPTMRGRERPTDASRDTWFGAFHVHSSASHDSRLTLDEIAAAARAIGLNFVVVTDHNEQVPGPVLRDGVVLLSYSELSSSFGHVIALGTAPPLSKKERRSDRVLSIIGERGGISIAAHPTDPKRPWTGVETTGIEITNVASRLRVAGGPTLLGLLPNLVAWPFRPKLALTTAYEKDEPALAMWDAEPRSPGFCGVDAHGWMGLERNLSLWNLKVEVPDASPETLLDQLKLGAFDCVAGLFGGRPHLELQLDDSGTIHFHGPTPALRLVLYRGGKPIADGITDRIELLAPAPGVYRGELQTDLPYPFFGRFTATLGYTHKIEVTAQP